MPIYRFAHGGLVMEVTAPSEAALDMSDVYGDGGRLSFEAGSKIIVDFGMRMLIEERGATLAYRILEGGEEIFSAAGRAGRTYRGGDRKKSFDPIVYSF